jgi:hypothetical protein
MVSRIEEKTRSYGIKQRDVRSNGEILNASVNISFIHIFQVVTFKTVEQRTRVFETGAQKKIV